MAADGSGGFFRRTLGSARVSESEFLLPVTNSRKLDSELSLLRLFRPLHGHGDFCTGDELPVLLVILPAIQRWRESRFEFEAEPPIPCLGGYCPAARAPQRGLPQSIVELKWVAQPYIICRRSDDCSMSSKPQWPSKSCCCGNSSCWGVLRTGKIATKLLF